MNQSQYRVKTCRWHSAENAMTCFTFSCLTCGRSQRWGRKFALSAKKLNYKMLNKYWLSWVCFARIWSQMYFVFLKVSKRKRRSLGVALAPLQIAVHQTLQFSTDGAANTIATAATTKLSQDRPGTSCKYIPTIFRVRRWNCMEWPYRWNLFSKTFVRY